MKYNDTDGQPLVEKIRDSAGQKGTGKWTAICSLEYGVPVTLIGQSQLSSFIPQGFFYIYYKVLLFFMDFSHHTVWISHFFMDFHILGSFLTFLYGYPTFFDLLHTS